ncbi:DUF397 domain-containing protein [Nocardiopsis terrae]
MKEEWVWHKSSHSDGRGGDCVEVAEGPTTTRFRDTQNRQLGYLEAPSAEWAALVAAARGQ